MLVVLVIVVFLLIGIADFPELISKKKWKEIIVLAVCYAGVFILAIMLVTRGEIPSPMKAIHHFVDTYLKLSYPPPPE
jgi:multisubunit Na+/H+ antiporter MnhC subunit